jgi:hypothetical protein
VLNFSWRCLAKAAGPNEEGVDRKSSSFRTADWIMGSSANVCMGMV